MTLETLAGRVAQAIDTGFTRRTPTARGAAQYDLGKRNGYGSTLSSVLEPCPRCLGDLVVRRDLGGEYYACPQCRVDIEPRLGSD